MNRSGYKKKYEVLESTPCRDGVSELYDLGNGMEIEHCWATENVAISTILYPRGKHFNYNSIVD